MAFRPAPRRQLSLDAYYREQGGVRTYAFARLNEGVRVPDLAAEFSAAINDTVSPTSLYDWIREWRAEEVIAA